MCRILQWFAKEPASVGGDPEAGGHDRVQRETVRHDAAVPAHPLPTHTERALLHAPLRATHGPSRQVHSFFHLKRNACLGGLISSMRIVLFRCYTVTVWR
jgi:hypothetical protein